MDLNDICYYMLTMFNRYPIFKPAFLFLRDVTEIFTAGISNTHFHAVCKG